MRTYRSREELGFVISELLAYIDILEGWLDPEQILVSKDLMRELTGPAEAPSSYGMTYPRETQ